ncbi:ATP-binding protein [Microbacterium trichothecenolyticum]|uniref:ATPase n=1 Tax=Microbacterium trichothecenolyticum TaxID=69370 RepID=A0ABU0TX66_MICTR|nr:AAA family ATPase [Microbacterium trichothecenolyticum]MDQ1124229.1 putative ATPase [Microbacterium trichothecenolyticum]
MRVRFFGGLSVSTDAGDAVVPGRGQQSLLLRLAVDAGTTVSARALIEDLWPMDAPEDPRAALQSLVSRLRRSLPGASVSSTPGGYRLDLTRDDIDVTRFQDLVAEARATGDPARAREALALWTGEVWTPGDGFDWLRRDLLEDRAHAERLAASIPAPASTSVPSLPVAVTRLIGRADELDAIRERLTTDRLVTVLGPGGAGKTTLAVETARTVADSIVVELAPAASGDVWTAIAGAVGRRIRLPESSGPPLSAAERVAESVAGRTVVIVLDNCEHVVREAAEAALALLGMSAGVRVLATSREPLGIPGEAFVDLGPLPPDDAGALFAQRVRSARGHVPDDDERDTAQRIVRRLDGLPLAIELAAARARTLTLREIDEGLDDRFALLSNGPRLSSERHRTLRALIDWSWDTLTDGERVALQATAVFPDGIGASDTVAVARGFAMDAGTFDALVDRSLLVRREGRFRMLETVRDYGLDRLRRTGEEASFRARAADVLTDLAAHRDTIVRGPRLGEALAWFDANDENLTAALRARADSGNRLGGARLLRNLLWPWAVRERSEDLRRGVADFADAGAPLDDESVVVVEAVALFLAAFPEPGAAASITPAQYEARRLLLEAAAQRHPSEMTTLVAPLLRVAGSLLAAGEREHARTWQVDVTDDEIAARPPWTRAMLHALRAGAAQNSGDTATLGVESEIALTMFVELGDPWGTGFASQLRSEWLVLQDRLDEALTVIDRSTEAIRGLTSASDVLQQQTQAAGILLRLGRLDEARARSERITVAADADGSARSRAQALMTRAHVEVAAGDGEAALHAVEGVPLGPGFPDQVAAWRDAQRAQALLLLGRHDEARAALRTALPLAVGVRDHPIIAVVLLAVAGWNAATGRRDLAEEALARAAAIRGAADLRDPFLLWIRARLAELPAARTAGGTGIHVPLANVDVEALTALLA